MAILALEFEPVSRLTSWKPILLKGTPFASPLPRQGVVLQGVDGDNRIYAESTIPAVGWHVLAGVSTKQAFADARRSLRDRGAL